MVSNINFLDYYLAVKPFPIRIETGNKIVINTINQYSYCIAERDIAFREALKNSDILLPDGIGIVRACSYLTGISIDKIAGAEMHQHLLKQLENLKGKCFYLGSSENTLNKITKRLKSEYSDISVEFYSPPYKKSFDEKDIALMVEKINRFKPTVVFIGLTAPKQEKLAYILKERIDTSVICTIGAVFDFYALTIQRPNQFWIDKNLEWLIRFAKEPKRMWKRYLYFGIVFGYSIVKKKSTLKNLIHIT